MKTKATRAAGVTVFAFFAAIAADATGAMAALPTSSGDLIEKAKVFDGKAVVFEGEAIGDPLPRGDFAWINVSDGNYAIGVWLPRGYLVRVESYGSYRQRGDRLRVLGEFRRACPDHGGDMDIHAASIEAVERGAPLRHPMDATRIALGAVLLATGAASLVLWRKRTES
jgi:hypothetical protein